MRDPSSEYSKQPGSSDNALRSIQQEIFVVVAICTHLGVLRPISQSKPVLIKIGPVVFYYLSWFFIDLAGQLYKKVPAPTNLMVPPYYFSDPNTIVIGANKPGETNNV